MRLDAPFNEEKIRALRVGDLVEISGLVYTGRDSVHKYLYDGNPPPVDLSDGIIYHCGPVVSGLDTKQYEFVAAGPTTSIREEPYQAEVMKHFNAKGVIGKGGMGAKTLKGCQEVPFAYMHAIGGAATYIAQSVTRVLGVHKYDFGVPEAMWVIEVKDFPVVVTMDAHGQSLHEVVEKESARVLAELLAK